MTHRGGINVTGSAAPRRPLVLAQNEIDVALMLAASRGARTRERMDRTRHVLPFALMLFCIFVFGYDAGLLVR